MASTENELSLVLNEFTQKLREISKKKFRFLAKKINNRLLSKYKEAISKNLSEKSEIEKLNRKLLKLRGLNLVFQADLGFEDSEESLEDSSAEEAVDSLEVSDHSINSDIENVSDSEEESGKLQDIAEDSEKEVENQDSKETSFDCHICQKNFKYRSYLKQHLKTHNKRYKCNRCGDIFKTILDLQVHRHVHAHEKPFKCDFCGIGFKVENNMKEHRRIHTGEKYTCDICDKQFTQKPALYNHRKIHTDDGSRPFECEKCNKKFRIKSQLDRHGLVHSDARPFNCDRCLKNFKCKSDLRWGLRFFLRLFI